MCGNHYPLKNSLWECSADYTPSGFSNDRNNHLLDIEQEHFWFAPRDQLLRTKLLTLKRPSDHRLLELGCGSGRVLATLETEFPHSVGIEGHLKALERAVHRCPTSNLVHGNVLNTPLVSDQFDWVVAFDVLEHVDPKAFLREAYRLTRPGGMLLLSVPAFPMLWSRVDELAGHRCRYRLKTLTEELITSGWQMRGHTYFQFFLFPLLAANRLLNQRSQSKIERKPPQILNRILGSINQLEFKLFNRLSLPFGSSLIAWAEKPFLPAGDL